MRQILSGCLIAAALLCAGPAQSQASSPNDTCLMCHKDPAAKGAAGQSIGLDHAAFSASVHGSLGLKCSDCHTDASAARLPHAPKLKPVECGSCHDDAVKQYGATVHGKARASGKQAAAACGDCHGPTHAVLRSTDPKSRTNHDNREATCGSCHGNDALIKKAGLPGGNVQATYHDSIHGRLIHGGDSRQANAPSCTSCHGAHDIQAKTEPGSRVARAQIPDTCGSCHQRAKLVYEKGKHGSLQHAGNAAAPTCVDCHSAHAIQLASRPEWQVAVIGQCGSCHDDFVTSYRRTYHGKVTRLGFSDMATCASCHGAHDVRPASDPLSTVSAANRLQTCRGCHAEASARFASWDPHPQPTVRERSAVLYYTNIFMNVLLAGVFLFFGLHTILWAYRSIGDVLRRRGGKDS